MEKLSEGKYLCISTHTPREGRDRGSGRRNIRLCDFNSHAPRGARHSIREFARMQGIFQLTRPARGATSATSGGYRIALISTHTPREGRDAITIEVASDMYISTHTPREGRDLYRVQVGAFRDNFNSHAPRGARRQALRVSPSTQKFQLTRPARGATIKSIGNRGNLFISTHTPREGRDHWQNTTRTT